MSLLLNGTANSSAPTDAPSVFVAPFVAGMSAAVNDVEIDATAIAQQKVTIANIHHDYTASPLALSDASAMAFLNAFKISNDGVAGAQSMKAEVVNATLIGATVLEMINNNKAAIEADLKNDNSSAYSALIADSLAVSLVSTVDSDTTIDAASGATSAENNLTDAAAATIYLQIPQGQLEESDYMAQDGKLLTTAMAFNKGDSLVWVFDVVSAPGSVTLKYATWAETSALPVGVNAGATVGEVESNSYTLSENNTNNLYKYTLSGSTSGTTKRIALAMKFSSGGGAFPVGAGGLDAPLA